MQQLVLASSNLGKCQEINQYLHQFVPNLQVISQSEFIDQDAEETGLTFIENAILKARHAAQAAPHLPTLSDDSGLVVPALDGAPGVFSARYAGEPANNQANIDKLLTAMHNIPKQHRQASFVSVMVLMQDANDPLPKIFQGTWHGEILLERTGSGGFGYDPIFKVIDYNCSAAELPLEEKNTISHRGQALAQLKDYLISIS